MQYWMTGLIAHFQVTDTNIENIVFDYVFYTSPHAAKDCMIISSWINLIILSNKFTDSKSALTLKIFVDGNMLIMEIEKCSFVDVQSLLKVYYDSTTNI